MVTDEVRPSDEESTQEPTGLPDTPAEDAAPATSEAAPDTGEPSEPLVVESSESTTEEPPGEALEPEAPAVPEIPSNKHWYVVKVQSGREETIREAIERKVKIEGLEEYFGQIYIPTEKVTEMRNGKRYTRTKKKLPGYIMAEVEFNDRILYLFRETSGVGDFVGGTLHKPPPPMSPNEITRWLAPEPPPGEEKGKAALKHDFEKGERLRVKDGMFKDMEGEVKDILEEKNLVRIELTIFGRPVAVDLEYWQVEKV